MAIIDQHREDEPRSAPSTFGTRKILLCRDGLTVSTVRLNAGLQFASHAHDHDQLCVVLEGQYQESSEGNSVALRAGVSSGVAPASYMPTPSGQTTLKSFLLTLSRSVPGGSVSIRLGKPPISCPELSRISRYVVIVACTTAGFKPLGGIIHLSAPLRIQAAGAQRASGAARGCSAGIPVG